MSSPNQQRKRDEAAETLASMYNNPRDFREQGRTPADDPSSPRADTSSPSTSPLTHGIIGQATSSPSTHPSPSYRPRNWPSYSEATGRFTDRNIETTSTREEVTVTLSADDGPADVDYDDPEAFKFRQPKAPTFPIPVAGGGYRMETTPFDIDFNSQDSVKRANRHKNQVIWREKKRLGIEDIRRPSTRGREYSDAQDQFIRDEHRRYATQNNGKKLPLQVLADRFNARFQENPPRTQSSISGHISHVPALSQMRGQYDGADA